MVFASHVFLYWFLPAFLAVYFLAPRAWKAGVIALGSYVFYGWWIPWFVLLMAFSTLVDFQVGNRIRQAQEHGKRGGWWLALSCFTNLSLLGYFKYANFFVESFPEVSGQLGVDLSLWSEVVLPVGISFYTFQTMSYAIDVFRGDAPPVRRFVDFLCYVSMFPQLVAGPIVRYGTIALQLRERQHSPRLFASGVLFFQVGFAKKILIADNLAPLADRAFDSQAVIWTDAWLGLVAYAFQIYYDFSGYSDMAIGLGMMMGFTFPINFAQPYRALSITDFWRRWHISLSSWLRDYLYVPLGGNRRGRIRTYVNLAAVMILGGLWHGAAWTFVLWGAYQGFWLILERAIGKRGVLSRLPLAPQVAGTFLIVLGGWILFRAKSLDRVSTFLSDLIGVHGERPLASLEVTPLGLTTFLLAMVITWACPPSQQLVRTGRWWFILLLQILFLMATFHLHFQVHVPFIYFQF